MWVIEQHATIDYETASEAGQVWLPDKRKWTGPKGAEKKRGISAVGTFAYAEHPTTRVLTMSYKIPGDADVSRWRPGLPNPQRLFDWIAKGGLVEAHKVMFERAIWTHVCRRLYGWPDLPAAQLRCSMAKARVNCLPAALGDLTSVLPVKVRKDADGKRLLNKFSIPQNPTKKTDQVWITPEDEPEEAERLYSYCDDDVRAEEGASGIMMPMSAEELRFWLLDQEMNWRGIGIDRDATENMTAVLDQALEKYGDEFRTITGGLNPTQVEATKGWLLGNGVRVDKLDEEAIEEALLRRDLPPSCRRVLEIRGLIGSASVKKLYSISRIASNDDRVRDVIIHHGARTGRPKGEMFQPLNLPKSGPDLIYCEECKKPSKWPPVCCPWCGSRFSPVAALHKWPNTPKGYPEDFNPVDCIQEIMATRDLATVEYFFGDALLCISGCIRGMIVAAPDKELIASDYSAIEAVVTAALAKVEWRLDTFRRKEDIYLVSAAKITGKTLDFYKEYKENHGTNHEDRQKIGKVAELALGFGGWVGAWRKFDSTDTYSDDEVKANILAWRAANPEIVEMWGGQERGRPWEDNYRLERFGFEGAFLNAVQYPTMVFEAYGIKFYMRGDALIIRLLSGRELTYWQPRLHPSTRPYIGPGVLEITYMTWNSNPLYGPPGWGPMKTYGGRLTENIVQATAHDIQRFGILALEAAGYEVILHVYDEDIAEVPIGFGSLEEFERIMSTMPPWAHNWPIRASGGWRGKRYRKA